MSKYLFLVFINVFIFSSFSQEIESDEINNGLAIEKYNSELALCKPCNDTLKARILLSNAKLFIVSEDYSSAYYSLEMAIEKSRKARSIELEMLSYVALAEFFRNKGDNENALLYISKATSIVNSRDIEQGYTINYYNRYAAILAQVGGQPDSVIMLSKKTIELAKELGDLDLVASSLNELGFQYEHYGDEKDAIRSYQEAVDIWKDLKNNRYAANALMNLSRLKMKMGDYEGAFIVIEKGIELVDTNKWYSILVNLFDHKVSVFDHRGDYKSALDAHRKARWYAALTQSNRWTSEMASIENQLKIRKKDQAIEKEQSKSKLIKQELDAERKFLNGVLISLFGAVLLLTIILYYVVKFKKSNRKLNDTLSQKDLLLKEVHHRVKNNMQSVSSLLDIQSNFITDKKAREAINESQKRITSLALAHQNLYANDHYDSISIKEYLESILEKVIPKDVEYHAEIIDQELDIEKSQSIGFVVNELILNSIKHAWPDNKGLKTISFVFKLENGVYYFDYCDNGIGIDNEEDFLSSDSFGVTMIQSFLRRSFKTRINLIISKGFCVNFQFKL